MLMGAKGKFDQMLDNLVRIYGYTVGMFTWDELYYFLDSLF